MQRYVARRLMQAVPVLLLVTIMVFLLMRFLPGDPVLALIPIGESATDDEVALEAARERIRARYGLDKPLPVQYVLWVGRAARGDLGQSVRTRQPVSEMLLLKLPVTAQLALIAWLIAVAVAVPVGVLAAVKRNSVWDISATVGAMAGVAMPSFWLGILLILVFTWYWKLLPTPGGFVPIWDDPVRGMKVLILPALALGASSTASVMRLTRSSLLEVLAQDYVRTARAKGLSSLRVIWVHAMRNALLAVVTVMGLQWINLLGGSVIIEQMFAIPGMGRLAIDAIQGRDYPVVQGFVLFIAVLVIIVNLIVDVMYAVLDPRIRLAG
ncbi:MAG: ABC transporter permease [Chloroflexi bacterium]|nr:ABC transporter permease [Chloroflexota bacterium]